jgi:lipopolysaccharide export system protein LptA
MKSLITMAALAAAALTAQPAAAQPAPAKPAPAQTAASQPDNAKAPLDISADEAETHNAECTAIYRGSAEALQGISRLRADVMTATMERQTNKVKPAAGSASGAGGDSSCGALVSIEAKGSVYYVDSTRRMHGDKGFYDAASTTVTITGDVTAVEGDNVMRGTKMVYNTQTGEGHVEGGGKGPGAKNRPRGVFYPKQASTQATSPTTAQPTSQAPSKTPSTTPSKDSQPK